MRVPADVDGFESIASLDLDRTVMWTKICANTNLEDALLAAELGADAVGFVFAKSKRQVTAAQIARITPHLPGHLETVGVFHTHSAEEIAAIVRESGLKTVQLHGGYDPTQVERIRELVGAETGVILTLSWPADGSVELEASSSSVATGLEKIRRAHRETGVTDRALVDSRVGQEIGGTGISFDWKSAGEVFAAYSHGLRIIAAGGLNPGNLRQAVTWMRPWGIDVASGVEASPGRKDRKKLEEFLCIAKR